MDLILNLRLQGAACSLLLGLCGILLQLRVLQPGQSSLRLRNCRAKFIGARGALLRLLFCSSGQRQRRLHGGQPIRKHSRCRRKRGNTQKLARCVKQLLLLFARLPLQTASLAAGVRCALLRLCRLCLG